MCKTQKRKRNAVKKLFMSKPVAVMVGKFKAFHTFIGSVEINLKNLKFDFLSCDYELVYAIKKEKSTTMQLWLLVNN